MTSAHVFYIPSLLLLGAVLGFVLGRKLLVAEQEAARKTAARQAALRSTPAEND